ncbi:MAG: UDP-glucose 6-dehydrogenase [Bdellovibrionales bacterium GWB1_52_6]|nr:MAG: UDP-glucose 6-dehydrogenase [Bdellovibrionales bacterium GWB1_52_6]OFZ02928.1 MAG: UDP-glucose 6-dehydrogenase [Bdellovibrionales bacterium GWA1_52_35]HCM38512.1 UDP-glucose 6-dehydrogenase [Bdellovibrionales bacterium]
MKVAIIGTGYVGTVAGVCFADVGNSVICVEKDPVKLQALSEGNPVIFEPGLEELIKRGLNKNTLKFTDSIPQAVAESEVIFLTVGTPSLPNGDADLSFIEAAVREIAKCMSSPRIIVNKSTVPVGTNKLVSEWLRSETKLGFDVVSNPEFLREGVAIQDFMTPERVVIGTSKSEVYEKMRKLYSPFVTSESLILRMDPVSAELTKYACNAFLATRISFMNELSDLCDRAGGDIENIRRGMGLDSRIGKYFLNAGIGYGGSCFPKDIRALISTADLFGSPLEIVRATEEVNRRQKHHLVEAVRERLGTRLSGKTLAIWGLSFKPSTDDIREAPALVAIEDLLRLGATVRAYDPVAMENTRGKLKTRVHFAEDAYSAATGADALIIATEWPEFARPDLTQLHSIMRSYNIFDGRNVLNPTEVIAAGFYYRCIGRGQTINIQKLAATAPQPLILKPKPPQNLSA